MTVFKKFCACGAVFLLKHKNFNKTNALNGKIEVEPEKILGVVPELNAFFGLGHH
jgi:hypothetical protein